MFATFKSFLSHLKHNTIGLLRHVKQFFSELARDSMSFVQGMQMEHGIDDVKAMSVQMVDHVRGLLYGFHSKLKDGLIQTALPAVSGHEPLIAWSMIGVLGFFGSIVTLLSVKRLCSCMCCPCCPRCKKRRGERDHASPPSHSKRHQAQQVPLKSKKTQ